MLTKSGKPMIIVPCVLCLSQGVVTTESQQFVNCVHSIVVLVSAFWHRHAQKWFMHLCWCGLEVDHPMN